MITRPGQTSKKIVASALHLLTRLGEHGHFDICPAFNGTHLNCTTLNFNSYTFPPTNSYLMEPPYGLLIYSYHTQIVIVTTVVVANAGLVLGLCAELQPREIQNCCDPFFSFSVPFISSGMLSAYYRAALAFPFPVSTLSTASYPISTLFNGASATSVFNGMGDESLHTCYFQVYLPACTLHPRGPIDTSRSQLG